MRELIEAQKSRAAAGQGSAPVTKGGQERNPIPQPSVFACHFLALAHHQLGNKDDARKWSAKAVLPKDAPRQDAMFDRFLRPKVELENKHRLQSSSP